MKSDLLHRAPLSLCLSLCVQNYKERNVQKFCLWQEESHCICEETSHRAL